MTHAHDPAPGATRCEPCAQRSGPTGAATDGPADGPAGTPPRARAGPRRRWLGAAAALAGAGGLPARARAQTTTSGVAALRSPAPRLSELAAGLEHPWALAFLPDGRMLVTERPGRIALLSPDGRRATRLAGVPRVFASGQGGLLDLVPSPAFERDRTLFFSYAEPVANEGGGTLARTALASARLVDDTLRDLRVIFAGKPLSPTPAHFGSRIAFGRDGTLWLTLGDRFTLRNRVQQLDNHAGKIVRIDRDGGVPRDNPFVGTPGALPEIWSYGHRNLQGAAVHPDTGALWTHEHGAQGGDEVNVPRAGLNYGWPVITWGIDYNGDRIGEGSRKDGLEQPVHYWVPSIAPSGMAFYTGALFPEWRGNLLVGSLKFGLLVRLALAGESVTGEERLLNDLRMRVRDVRQGPDGAVYLLTDDANGRLLRLAP
jgi:glucose/arabinose dehydrogenase